MTEELYTHYESLGAEEVLSCFLLGSGKNFVLASSLGAEDQVLTHMALKINPDVTVFTIDTCRLYAETLELKGVMESRYAFCYKVYKPLPESVEEFERISGKDSIYESVENRKSCCYIRKIEPLQRALAGVGGWITGIRREQSPTRINVPKVSVDDAHGGIIKVNPLADWNNEDVWNYIHKHNVPYNPLHDKGYASIGCEPCTRAVRAFEDPRAGRWWWENSKKKECGLHVDR